MHRTPTQLASCSTLDPGSSPVERINASIIKIGGKTTARRRRINVDVTAGESETMNIEIFSDTSKPGCNEPQRLEGTRTHCNTTNNNVMLMWFFPFRCEHSNHISSATPLESGPASRGLVFAQRQSSSSPGGNKYTGARQHKHTQTRCWGSTLARSQDPSRM